LNPAAENENKEGLMEDSGLAARLHMDKQFRMQDICARGFIGPSGWAVIEEGFL